MITGLTTVEELEFLVVTQLLVVEMIMQVDSQQLKIIMQPLKLPQQSIVVSP